MTTIFKTTTMVLLCSGRYRPSHSFKFFFIFIHFIHFNRTPCTYFSHLHSPISIETSTRKTAFVLLVPLFIIFLHNLFLSHSPGTKFHFYCLIHSTLPPSKFIHTCFSVFHFLMLILCQTLVSMS